MYPAVASVITRSSLGSVSPPLSKFSVLPSGVKPAWSPKRGAGSGRRPLRGGRPPKAGSALAA
eukprot:1172447-Pyramimonas_sp.AAC.1